MRTNALIALITLFLVGGCAASKTEMSATKASPAERERMWDQYDSHRVPSSVALHTCVAKKGPRCRAKIAWACPAGYVDGCTTSASSGSHECVVVEGSVGCGASAEIACAAGFEDGCKSGSSTKHQCQPLRGVPCTQKAKLECAEGFRDSCLAEAGAKGKK